MKKTRRQLFAEIRSLTSYKESANARIDELRGIVRDHDPYFNHGSNY